MKKCPFNPADEGYTLKRVPNYHPSVTRDDLKSLSVNRQITRWKKNKIRRELADRLGIRRSSISKELRICNRHSTELWRLYMSKIPIIDKEDMEICATRENVFVQMPKPVGLKSDFSPSPCKRINKGNETIRQRVRWIKTEY